MRGARTSEFWVTVLTSVAAVITAWAGKDFPQEAFVLLGTYVVGRAGEKVVKARKG